MQYFYPLTIFFSFYSCPEANSSSLKVTFFFRTALVDRPEQVSKMKHLTSNLVVADVMNESSNFEIKEKSNECKGNRSSNKRTVFLCSSNKTIYTHHSSCQISFISRECVNMNFLFSSLSLVQTLNEDHFFEQRLFGQVKYFSQSRGRIVAECEKHFSGVSMMRREE